MELAFSHLISNANLSVADVMESTRAFTMIHDIASLGDCMWEEIVVMLWERLDPNNILNQANRYLIFQIFELLPLCTPQGAKQTSEKLLLSLENAEELKQFQINNILTLLYMFPTKFDARVVSNICTERAVKCLMKLAEDSEIDVHTSLLACLVLENFYKTAPQPRDTLENLGFVEMIENIHDSTECHVTRLVTEWILLHTLCKEERIEKMKETPRAVIRLSESHKTNFIKISFTGLEVRNDPSMSNALGSARANVYVKKMSNEGTEKSSEKIRRIYYEATIRTSGLMRIGWASRENFDAEQGRGVGEYGFSYAYDGARNHYFASGLSHLSYRSGWKSGDVIGCLADFHEGRIFFYKNGERVNQSHIRLVNLETLELYPAISLDTFQQLNLNFGLLPFSYKPKKCISVCEYEKLFELNTAELERETEEEMEELKNACTICYSYEACTQLEPCSHKGFCYNCAIRLTQCPICRAKINVRTLLIEEVLEGYCKEEMEKKVDRNTINKDDTDNNDSDTHNHHQDFHNDPDHYDDYDDYDYDEDYHYDDPYNHHSYHYQHDDY